MSTPPTEDAFTWEALAAHVKASTDRKADLEADFETAVALVDARIGNAQGVPDTVRERAVLACGGELWTQRDARGGIVAQFGDLGQAGGMRLARDPMVAAMPLLAPFLPVVIA